MAECYYKKLNPPFMKQILTILILLFSLTMYGCASSGGTSSSDSTNKGNEILIHNPEIGLDDYIKRLSGVRVYGSGVAARVEMRGISTFELSTSPLFIMDGVRVGRDFSQVYRMVSMNSVNTIKALNSSKATTHYGHDGYAGVIEIITGN